jgi:hypothetical protein
LQPEKVNPQMDDGPSYRFLINNRHINAVEVAHIAPGKCAFSFASLQTDTFVYSLPGFSKGCKE